MTFCGSPDRTLRHQGEKKAKKENEGDSHNKTKPVHGAGKKRAVKRLSLPSTITHREKAREKFAEALGLSEAAEGEDHVLEVAAECEQSLHQANASSSAHYLQAFRRLIPALKANGALREQVLAHEVGAEQLVRMTSKYTCTSVYGVILCVCVGGGEVYPSTTCR